MEDGLVYSIFGKKIHSLTKEDLIQYFENERRETNIVEFKAYVDEEKQSGSKSKRDKEKLLDIIKTICAFLNSDGGLLIWGAPVGIKKDDEPVYLGPLTNVDYKISPDQFTNFIASEISPTPLRVLFQPIGLDNGTFCYVFEIDKSEFAPHQFRGTYYMRLDGSTRYAPHRYVEALIKRITFPKIEGYLTFGPIRETRDYSIMTVQLTIHNLSPLINEKNVSYRIIATAGDFFSSSANDIGDRHNQADFIKRQHPFFIATCPFQITLYLLQIVVSHIKNLLHRQLF